MPVMTHIDYFEAQKLARDANPRNLRRQAAIGALIVFLGGGYAVWHANAKTESAGPAAMPATAVSVQSVQPHNVTPFAQFSGRISAVDYAEIRPQVVGRITEIR